MVEIGCSIHPGPINKMKKYLLILSIFALLFLIGCKNPTGDVVNEKVIDIAKIRCSDGSLVYKAENCPDLKIDTKDLVEINAQELKKIIQEIISSNLEYNSDFTVNKENNDVYIEMSYYSTDEKTITQASHEFMNELTKNLKNYKEINLYLTFKGIDYLPSPQLCQ